MIGPFSKAWRLLLMTITTIGLAVPEQATAQVQDVSTDRSVLNGSNIVPNFKALQLRGVVDLSSETRIELARTGQPIWYVVEDPTASLDTIVRRECGEQKPEAMQFLLSEALRLNVIDSLGATFEPGDALLIPFCLKVERNGIVTVQPGDTPSEILKREYGVFGNLTNRAFYKANKGGYSSFRDFTQSLRVGEQLTVPFTAEQRIYSPLSPTSANFETLLASVPNRRVREQLQMSAVPVTEDPARAPYALDYVETVELSGTGFSEDCNGTAGQIAQIVDAAALAKRFDAELSERRRLGDSSSFAKTTTVGIIDSGLGEIGDDFFKTSFFVPNVMERNAESEEPGRKADDDGNGFNDDIYGLNFTKLNDSNSGLQPIRNAHKAGHGTKMAALILGGLDLAPNWNGKFTPPPVRLKVVKFTNHIQMTANARELPVAINYLAKNTDSLIVNMSLKTNQNPILIRNAIQENDKLLFVVAAGNRLSGGRNISDFIINPARLGGNVKAPNVITVAAHDLSGKRAAFSHFSPTHVDLLAPGCAVQTRTHENTVVLENGTSPAAAIVSFAAALVRTLMLKDASAKDVKSRLLMGTDHDLALIDDSHMSGRLNIIKAISVFHDVVQLKTGEMLFGRLTNPSLLPSICQAPPPASTSALKIVPNIGGADVRNVIFWTTVEDDFVRRECKQVAESFQVTLSVGGTDRTIPLSNIREVVLGTIVDR